MKSFSNSRKKTSVKWRRVDLCIALFLLIAFMAGCGSSDISRDIPTVVRDRHSTDINRSLFDKLNSSRVLLVADNAHGQWQPRQTIIDLLEYWFRMSIPDSTFASSGRKLALVLEVDSLYLARALKYGGTGDPRDILTVELMCPGVFTTADMEFFCRLGSLLRRIESYNSSLTTDQHIVLTLIPGETSIDQNDWSFDKRTDYFLHDRDSLISNRIVHFAENHRDYKILAFYGAAHLQRGVIDKYIDGKSEPGRFLADYLDNLADGDICTVGQVTRDYWGGSRYLFLADGREYVLPTGDSNSKIREMLAGPFNYDMVIVHPRAYNWGTPILEIPSINIADLAVAAMPDIMNTSNDYYRGYWPRLLNYLNAVSGKSPHRLNLADSASLEHEYESWKRWLATTRKNIVPDVESLRLWHRLIDSLAAATGPTAGRFEQEIISLLPHAPELDSSNEMPTPSERATELREYLVSDSINIVIDNLVGIAWVGNDLERRAAVESLIKITDSTFSDPVQWSSWRRRQTIGAIQPFR